MKHKLLVVLQNAYAKEALARGWNPSTWRREFETSRSGMRLSGALPSERHGWSIHFTNASPVLADHVDAAPPASPAHLRRALQRVKPDIVLACGRVAEEAVQAIWPGALITVPHPACRIVTNALFDACKSALVCWGILRETPQLSPMSMDAIALAVKRSGDPTRLAIRQLRRGLSFEQVLPYWMERPRRRGAAHE